LGIERFFESDSGAAREERIAEAKALAPACGEGDEDACENMERALEAYRESADEVEKEVSPDEKEEEDRRTKAIRGEIVREIAKTAPPRYKDDFVKIVVKEKGINSAAEIASKIKDLCEDLKHEDPQLAYKVCAPGDDGPKWQKEMFEDLTAEQEAEVEKFVEVIGACFEDPTDCNCEESTNIESFVDKCKVITGAEVACRNGDDAACEVAKETGDDIFNSLNDAPHLQKAMEMIEKKFSKFEDDRFDDRFDHKMPKECEGMNKDECKEVMTNKGIEHAPEECREALREAMENGNNNEWDSRRICDKIMMQKHAPECVAKGIEDPEECRKFMYGIENRDPICQENSIHDMRDCESFLKSTGKYKGRGYRENQKKKEGPDFNFNCKEIEDSTKRLECYDGATTGFKNFEKDFGEIKERERECADKCHDEDKAWDFSGGNCKCYGGDYYEKKEDEWSGYDCNVLDCDQGSHCEPDFGCVDDDGSSSTGGDDGSSSGGGSDSGSSDGSTDDGSDDGSTDGGDDGSTDSGSSDGDSSSDDGSGDSDSSSEDDGSSDDGDSSSDDGSSDGGDSGSSDSGDSGGDSAPITGNAFLDYDRFGW